LSFVFVFAGNKKRKERKKKKRKKEVFLVDLV
jgi:hypothetical protein